MTHKYSKTEIQFYELDYLTTKSQISKLARDMFALLSKWPTRVRGLCPSCTQDFEECDREKNNAVAKKQQVLVATAK